MDPASHTRRTAAVVAALLCTAVAAHAAAPDHASPAPLTAGPLRLDLSAALAQPDPAQPSAAQPEPSQPPSAAEPATDPLLTAPGSPRRIGFGRAGSEWLTIGAGFGYDLGEDKDFNLHAAYSQFLADELEFAVEFAGWYFAQDQDDTGGVSGSMVFRWHFLHDEPYDWTFFGDVGIGLLAAFDEVPNGGQEFNFLPRAGIGYTRRIADDGTRLQLGVRWHHVSNGRYTGDVNNPSNDSVLFYAAIVIPF